MAKTDLDSLLAQFTRYIRVEKGLAPATVAAYGSDLHLFLEFLGENNLAEINDLKREDLLAFTSAQKKIGKEDRTLARQITSIRNFLIFVEGEGLIAEPFVGELESFRIPEHFPDFLSLDETLKLFAESEDQRKDPESIRDRLILKSLYVLGLRVSELCSLEMQHLQLEEGFVRVTGKGSKVRLIPIYPGAAKEITNFVNDVRPFFKPAPSERGIFLSRLGKPLSRVSVWKILKKKAAETGVRATVHPHTLRHSFATHLIQNGADIRTVQELLGHTDVRTTEIYTHLSPEKLREDLKRCHPFYR